MEDFFKRALSEHNGDPSSLRINVFIVVVLFAFACTYGFVWVLIYYKELIISYLIVLMSTITAALGLKVRQKRWENGQIDTATNTDEDKITK